MINKINFKARSGMFMKNYRYNFATVIFIIAFFMVGQNQLIADKSKKPIEVQNSKVQLAYKTFKDVSNARATRNPEKYYNVFTKSEKKRFQEVAKVSSDAQSIAAFTKILKKIPQRELIELEVFEILYAEESNGAIILHTINPNSKSDWIFYKNNYTPVKDNIHPFSLVFVLEEGRYKLNGKLAENGKIVSFFSGNDAIAMIQGRNQ